MIIRASDSANAVYILCIYLYSCRLAGTRWLVKYCATGSIAFSERKILYFGEQYE